jgi:hypothetical protein
MDRSPKIVASLNLCRAPTHSLSRHPNL